MIYPPILLSMTNAYPLFYMINCAHPDHFQHLLLGLGDQQQTLQPAWTTRIQALRVNASKLSHADLNACSTLDDGNPRELASQLQILQQCVPSLRVFGGCCGTDSRHIEAIATSCGKGTYGVQV